MAEALAKKDILESRPKKEGRRDEAIEVNYGVCGSICKSLLLISVEGV